MDLDKRFNAPFLSRLPLELLNLWSTLDLLQLCCNTDVDPTFKKRATVDLLVFLLESENFGFCGQLACRYCYRLANSRFISPPAAALIEYIKVFLLYVRNDGASSHTGITNVNVTPKDLFPNAERVGQALTIKGYPPAFHAPPRADAKGLRSGGASRPEAGKRSYSSFGSVEGLPPQRSDVEAPLSAGLPGPAQIIPHEATASPSPSRAHYDPFADPSLSHLDWHSPQPAHSPERKIPDCPSPWFPAVAGTHVTPTTTPSSPSFFIDPVSVKRQRPEDESRN